MYSGFFCFNLWSDAVNSHLSPSIFLSSSVFFHVSHFTFLSPLTMHLSYNDTKSHANSLVAA